MSQNAPGKHFRKGITMMELFKMFPDDEAAMKWFEKRIWGGHPKCPRCGNHHITKTNNQSMPYYCAGLGKCNRRFSVRVGTVMESSRLGYQKWAVATYMFATNLKGVSSMKLHRDLGITQKSAWFMVHRLRESWKQLAGIDGMDGPVEIDETYVGGSETNRHMAYKGKKTKTAVVGVKDRETNRISAQPVPETTKARLTNFVENHVEPTSKKYTDENPSYGSLSNHESVKHSVGEYVLGQAHINGMESFWAMVKRGYDGTFHHLSEQHLHRYVNEFAGRHNIRELDTIEMMGVMAEGMAGQRLTYRDLVG